MSLDSSWEIVHVFYDADCGFCQACVDWLTPRLGEPRPVFIPLDSPDGRELRTRYGTGIEADSIVRIEAGTVLTKSDAVITLLSKCSFPWNLARLGHGVPRRLRDGLYDLTARNRHRFWGSRCQVD